ncbi:unnamed protein product [Prunus armeniaca]
MNWALLGIRPLSSPMPPKKRTRSKTIKEEHASEGAFTLIDLVAAIHAMVETQREMVDTIKKLRSSVSKPNEENERPPQEESAAAGKGSEQKRPPFVTKEDVIAMLEKEQSRSQED